MIRAAFLLFGGLTAEADSVFLQLLEGEGLVPLVVDLPASARRVATVPEEHLLLDPADLPSLMHGLRSWSERFRIAGVHNTSEMFVEAAALAADYLGLPGPGLRAARVCRNKLLQRMYCIELGPPFVSFLARAAVPAFEHYPAILKPAGRRGGSGVVLVTSPVAAADRLAAYAPDEVMLLERYLRGRDFSVETLVQGGRVLFENVTEEHEDAAGRANLEMGYTIPAVGLPPELIERAYQLNRQVVSRLRFEDGILHAEYKTGEDGEIYLIEAAARNPGDGLLAMYHLATGQPLERAILDIALGRPASYPRPNRYARQIYLEADPGTLVGVEVNGFAATPHYPGMGPGRRPALDLASPGLREIRMDKACGSRIVKLEQADDRVGSVIFDAGSTTELDALERRVRAGVRIVVNHPE
ncbi:MAG: ATP-grasp domain-containing protein [Kofleriaceae bacterium]